MIKKVNPQSLKGWNHLTPMTTPPHPGQGNATCVPRNCVKQNKKFARHNTSKQNYLVLK